MTTYVNVRLTKRQAEAIQEALIFRLTGELGDEAMPEQAYDQALTKISDALSENE